MHVACIFESLTLTASWFLETIKKVSVIEITKQINFKQI